MALTKRSGKGSALTNTELDANFTHLGGDGTFPVPSTKGTAGQVLKMNAGATALEFATDATGSGGIASVVADTSPQLGGSLDVNGQSIVSASAGNIAITPDGAGKVILDGLSHPTADGTSGQALTTDGSGNLAFNSLASSLTIQDEGSVLSSAPSILNFVGNGVTVTGNGNSTKTITISGGGGAGSTVYNNASSLPLSGNSDGDMAFAKDTNRLYVWNGAGWYSIALVNAAPTISSGATSLNLATDGTATVVTITATDPEGAPLTYTYSVTGGSLTNGGGATATVVQGTGANINKFTITPTTTEGYAGTFTLTFTASDGVSTATSPATYTLVFSLPQIASTLLKVKTSGTNGRNNSVYDDSSTGNLTVTPTGAGAFQTTLTPYKTQGEWSGYFDGNDIVHFDHASDFNFSNSDFCAEAWVKQEAVNAGAFSESVIFTTALGNDQQGISLHLASGTTLFILAGNGGWTMNTGAIAGAVLEIGKWHHIAFTRYSNNIYLYFDGKLVYTQSFTTTLTNTNNKFAIGGRNSPHVHYFKGWISNVRVVKGASVYNGASGIKPPLDPLTAVSGTVLLTCNGNRFVDFSGGSAKTVAFVGDPEISDFVPVNMINPWKTSKGGSAYIAGTGDYLHITNNTDLIFGTGDFTIQCWLYIVSQATSYASIIDFRGDVTRNDASAISLVYDASKMYIYNNGFKVNNLPRTLNRWQHIVFQRRTIGGTPTNEFYIDGALVHTGADSTNWTANNGIDIGTSYWGDHGNFYISDLRIDKGSAAYSAAFTPPTAPVALASDTKLKLNFSQPGVFDSVSKTRLSLVGAGVQESSANTKYATTNLRLAPGNSRYGLIEDLDPPRTGDFQIETWVYLDANQTVVTSQGAGIFRMFATTAGDSSTHNGASMMILSSKLHLNLDYGGSNFPDTGDTISQVNWHHLAYVRVDGKIFIFLNGTEIYNVANTIDFTGTTGYLGTFYNSTAHCIDGYLEDFRYLKGHTTYPNEVP